MQFINILLMAVETTDWNLKTTIFKEEAFKKNSVKVTFT